MKLTLSYLIRWSNNWNNQRINTTTELFLCCSPSLGLSDLLLMNFTLQNSNTRSLAKSQEKNVSTPTASGNNNQIRWPRVLLPFRKLRRASWPDNVFLVFQTCNSICVVDVNKCSAESSSCAPFLEEINQEPPRAYLLSRYLGIRFVSSPSHSNKSKFFQLISLATIRHDLCLILPLLSKTATESEPGLYFIVPSWNRTTGFATEWQIVPECAVQCTKCIGTGTGTERRKRVEPPQ